MEVGQPVMVKNMRPGDNWIPEVILKYLGPVSFLVDIREGRTWKRHTDHLKILAELVHEAILVPEPTLMEPNIVASAPVTSDMKEVPACEKQTVLAPASDSPKPIAVSTLTRTHSPIQPSTTQSCSHCQHCHITLQTI